MALLKALCWALIFIIRIRFPPGTSLAMILNKIHNNVIVQSLIVFLTVSTSSTVQLSLHGAVVAMIDAESVCVLLLLFIHILSGMR